MTEDTLLLGARAPASAVTEEPLLFGAGGRLFGVLTRPSEPPLGMGPPLVFLFLTAGVMHRVGPYRSYVRLGRQLARMGFSSLRVDLAGAGDSPARPGLTNQASVAADFAEILTVLDSRLGRLPLVLGGLCSGADNATRLTIDEPRVMGMVLLDPVSFPDRRIRAGLVFAKYISPAAYVAGLKRRLKRLDKSIDPRAIRDLPTLEQQRAAFEAIHGRGGRVLSIFTGYSVRYYNRAGQFGRVLQVNDYQRFCTELFWPQVDHTYRLEEHRLRLIQVVSTWAIDLIHVNQRLPSIGGKVAPVDAAAMLAPGCK